MTVLVARRIIVHLDSVNHGSTRTTLRVVDSNRKNKHFSYISDRCKFHFEPPAFIKQVSTNLHAKSKES
jgi:hypothetical protein